MTNELTGLIEEATRRRMTAEELADQAISFAYGNGHIDDPRVTREAVANAIPREEMLEWARRIFEVNRARVEGTSRH